MTIAIGSNLKGALGKYAKEEGTKTDDAAITLIEEGLFSKGYIEGED
jgi:hypothetical protein